MATHTIQSEKELLLRTAGGDEQAFTLLVDLYWNKVYSHALAYTKKQVAAQEITQDIFLNIWHKRLRLPEVTNFSNYLFIAGKHQIISFMRQNLEETQCLEDAFFQETTLQPDLQLNYKEAYESLLTAIEKLPPARRQVFKMSRLEGLSYEEISQKLNISRNTIKEHIVKSLNFLRQSLKNEGRWLSLLLLFFCFF